MTLQLRTFRRRRSRRQGLVAAAAVEPVAAVAIELMVKACAGEGAGRGHAGEHDPGGTFHGASRVEGVEPPYIAAPTVVVISAQARTPDPAHGIRTLMK